MPVSCPFCKSSVEPTVDAAGKKLCPACQNTGIVARAAPAASASPVPGIAWKPIAAIFVAFLVVAGAALGYWLARPAPQGDATERVLDGPQEPEGRAVPEGALDGLRDVDGLPCGRLTIPSSYPTTFVKQGEVVLLYADVGLETAKGERTAVSACSPVTTFLQVQGPTVEVQGGVAAPFWFRAPVLPGQDESAEIVLHVRAANALGSVGPVPMTFVVQGGSGNHAPVADAGPDYGIDGGSPCALDGRGSYDPDGEAVTYDWALVEGPGMAPARLSGANPAFYCPEVPGTLRYRLTVSDGRLEGHDEVVITVGANRAPRIQVTATPLQPKVGDVVTLDASATVDPDGDALRFEWLEWNTDGGFAISGADTPVATFTVTKAGHFQYNLSVYDATAYTWQYVDVVVTA